MNSNTSIAYLDKYRKHTNDRIYNKDNGLKSNIDELLDQGDRHSTEILESAIEYIQIINKSKEEKAYLRSIENKNKSKLYSDCKDNLEDEILKLTKEKSAYHREIESLREEHRIMKLKLKNSLPSHSIFFMCFTILTFAIFSTLFFLQFTRGIFIIHPFYVVCGAFGSLGLFITGLLSLDDWKGWLDKDER